MLHDNPPPPQRNGTPAGSNADGKLFKSMRVIGRGMPFIRSPKQRMVAARPGRITGVVIGIDHPENRKLHPRVNANI